MQFCNKKIVLPSFASFTRALVLVVDRCGVAARSSSSLLAVAVAPGIACSDGSGGYGVQANQVGYRVQVDQVEHHVQVDQVDYRVQVDQVDHRVHCPVGSGGPGGTLCSGGSGRTRWHLEN